MFSDCSLVIQRYNPCFRAMRSHIFPLFNCVVFSSLYRTHGFERIKRRENYPELGTASYRMVKRFNLKNGNGGENCSSSSSKKGSIGSNEEVNDVIMKEEED